jgi:hypothetical protein
MEFVHLRWFIAVSKRNIQFAPAARKGETDVAIVDVHGSIVEGENSMPPFFHYAPHGNQKVWVFSKVI